MTKGLPRSLSRASLPRSPIQIHTIILEAEAISVVGATGIGFGGVTVGDFPEGNVLILGAVGNVQFSGSGSDSDLIDTWVGDYAIGSTLVDATTFDAADADMVPSTALAAASSEVSPKTRGVSTATLGGAVLDNTDGDLEINLNLLIDDTSISGTVDITASGEVFLSYIILGDD